MGYVTDLYANPSDIDEARRQILEARVFSAIDKVAAEALSYIERTGKPPSDSVLRSGWASFLMSLMHRTPRRVKDIHAAVHRSRIEILEEVRSQNPKLRSLSDEELYSPKRADATYVTLMRDLVLSDRFGGFIVGMQWAITTMGADAFPLLTGDRPLIRSDGIAKDDGFMIVPISPSKYFIAAKDRAVIEFFGQEISENASAVLNDMMVRQAEDFVIGSDRSQMRFISNRLGLERVTQDPMGEVSWTSG